MTHIRSRVSVWHRIILYIVGALLLLFQNPCLAANEIDLFFVVDNSGSMRKNDPNFMMPETVRAFFQGLSPSTRAGMVMFDQQAHLLAPLEPIADDGARQRLIQSLEKINYRGQFTDSAAGIARALQELKTSTNSASQRCIIFLTDGIVDTGDREEDERLSQWLKNDLTVECRDEGIRIFGIAFTKNADYTLTQTLSRQTGGAYYQVADPEDIDRVFDRIKSQLVPQQSTVTPPPPQPNVKASLSPPSPPPPIEPPDTKAITKIRTVEQPAAFGKSTPAVPDQGGLKLSLFRILIIAGLILILAFLIFKFLGYRSATKKDAGGTSKAPLLIPEASKSPMAPGSEESPPQSQFHDLNQPENPIKEFNLATITIGRDKNNDFVIPQSTISTLHAKIEYRDKLFFLEDLRSTNGTSLNGRKIPPGQPTLIKSGDRIKFADREFKFERPDHLIGGNTVCMTVTDMSLNQQDLDPSVVVRADDGKFLNEALIKHLNQIKTLGARYNTFVDQHFTSEVLQSLTAYARENIRQTTKDSDQHCSTMINGQAYFVVCTLPVPIANASAWFSKRFEGFTKFILKWIHSDAYDVAACNVLCVITFGFDKGHWVSATIIPTNDDDDEQLEIVSVEFLTDSEKAKMGIEFDEMGRVL